MNITDQQIKGNWAEQYIAAQLSAQGCLIRHVTQGHDSGIDLYCESVKDGVPFLHFWCQVKTKKSWAGKRSRISISSKKKHIDYWLKQPIPVFIFLVPDKRQEEYTPFYICRVLDSTLSHSNKLVSFIKISNPANLSEFLESYLPLETYYWGLKDGTVSHLKTPIGKYKKNIPSGISQLFRRQTHHSIFNTLFTLGKDLLIQDVKERSILNNYPINLKDVPGYQDAKLSWFNRKWNFCQLIKVVLIFENYPTRLEKVRSVADKVKATLRLARKKRGLGLDFVPHYA